MFTKKRNPYIQTPHITYTQQLSTVQYNKLSRFICVLCLIFVNILINPFPTINIRNRKGHTNLSNIIVFYFIRLSIVEIVDIGCCSFRIKRSALYPLFYSPTSSHAMSHSVSFEFIARRICG